MNILSVHDISFEDITRLFEYANNYDGWSGKEVYDSRVFYDRRIMATIFFESSTRTRLSFETAMHRLGGNVISSSDPNSSSYVKGETIEDTINVVSQYVDAIAIRIPFKLNPIDCSAHVINAGDGTNEHPTQALLDAYTIWKKFNRINDLKIGIVGDLMYSRAIRSFIELLGRFNPDDKRKKPRNKFYLLDNTGMNNEFTSSDKVTADITYLHYGTEFNDIIPDLDVLYTNRIQKERYHPDFHWSSCFAVHQNHIDRLPEHAIVMNPGPRQQELPPTLKSPKIVYFEQAKNGVPVRMALLRWLFDYS